MNPLLEEGGERGKKSRKKDRRKGRREKGMCIGKCACVSILEVYKLNFGTYRKGWGEEERWGGSEEEGGK